MKITVTKILVFIFLISLFCSIQITFASTLNIDLYSMFSNDDISEIKNNDIDDELIIKEFIESENYYYLLISNLSKNKGVAISKIDKSNIENTQLFSIYNNDFLKGYYISSIYIDKKENIWLCLHNSNESRFCRLSSDEKISFINYDSIDTIHKFSEENIYWYNSNTKEMFSWDGDKTKVIQVKNDLIDFTEYENKIYYTNFSGDVYKMDKTEDTVIFNLFDSLGFDKNTDRIEKIDLVSTGDKLWITAGLITSTDVMIINTGLINITDNRVYNEIPIGRILKYHKNGDNSVYFLTSPFFPPVPNSFGETVVYELLIKDDTLTTNKSNIYFEELNQKYIDINSNVFTYNSIKDINGIVKTTVDNTTINYYFKYNHEDEEKASVKVKCNNIYIDFDSSPYIENGRTMVPIRALTYILGGVSSWNNGVVTLVKEDKKIVLEIGSYTAYFNDNPVKLDVCPVIKNGRTMIPLRFILENFSVDLEWNQDKREVIINKELQF